MEGTLTREHVVAELARLATDAEACRACPLGSVRTQAVFGVGSPEAELVFVGEAPGFHEDKQGEPFVGAAGQLLTKLIETKLGMSRSDVYICNVLKCRPPGNRDPLPAEVEACRPFLEQQLDLLGAAVIVPLGNFAAKLLLDTQTGITRLRGKRFPFRGAVLIPTFHPAAALRGGTAAGGIAEDFEEIRRALDERPEAPEEPPAEQLGLF
jgi:uracil-DNA glycosylase